jgi:dihydrofolate reductase
MSLFIADLFMTLDGYGTGTEGFWGKGGAQLREWRHRTFTDPQQTLVFGTNTYGAMRKFGGPQLEPVDKVVISRSLEGPLDWPNCRLIAEDALEAVPRLKAESDVPLRCHGSLALNRSLLTAGLVDRLELTLFPIINGATGGNPVLAGMPDIDLELVESTLLDGQVQRFTYVPTVR